MAQAQSSQMYQWLVHSKVLSYGKHLFLLLIVSSVFKALLLSRYIHILSIQRKA